MDRLRDDIRRLTGSNEFKMLYPNEDPEVAGSKSVHVHTNPLIVRFWIQLVLGKSWKDGCCPNAPAFQGLVSLNTKLMGHFWDMNKIDKTQFPLPYAQIVKIL